MRVQREKKMYKKREINIKKMIIFIITIIVLITLTTNITGAESVISMIGAKDVKALANEEQESNSGISWVNSTYVNEEGIEVTDLDEKNNVIQIPVPKGYSASQIEGETSVNTGFVIYEGDINWSEIIVDGTNSVDELNLEVNKTEDLSKNTINTTVETNTVSEEVESLNENINILSEETTDEQIEEPETNVEEINNLDESNSLPNEVEISNEDVSTFSEDTNTITQTEINIYNLQKTTNQYVWIPVNDISRINGVDSNGKIWGKLYNYYSLGRTALNWSVTNNVIKITNATGRREPDQCHQFKKNLKSKIKKSILD